MPYSNYYKNSNLFHGSMSNIMGTRLDVVMLGDEALLSEVWKRIVAETERLHRMLNRFDAASDISHINREAANYPVKLNDELWQIMTDVKKYHQQTSGYFDVSMIDFNRVIMDDDCKTLIFTEKDIILDFGGYAKGYALQQIQEILLKSGIMQALVNFGNSSVLAVGSHPHGQYWGIDVENPFLSGQKLQTCKLYNQSLSVSGNTANHTQHIINPRSRQYSDERKLVSAISTNAVEAEVLSTALMVADENTIISIKNLFVNVNFSIFVV